MLSQQNRLSVNNNVALTSKCINAIGKDEFFTTLANSLFELTGYSAVAIYRYQSGNTPHLLLNSQLDHLRNSAMDLYFQGGYLLDPFIMAIDKGIESGIYDLSDLAPDDFFASQYYHTYYQRSGLKAEINLIFRSEDNTSYIVSIGSHSIISAHERQNICHRLNGLKEILFSLVDRHITLQSQLEGQQQLSFDSQLNVAFNKFGTEVLSDRERDIILLILKGYSSKSIATLLEISPDTVKVHRKRIHRKLEISSQAELFSLFISSMSMIAQDPNADPLALYLAEFNH